MEAPQIPWGQGLDVVHSGHRGWSGTRCLRTVSGVAQALSVGAPEPGGVAGPLLLLVQPRVATKGFLPWSSTVDGMHCRRPGSVCEHRALGQPAGHWGSSPGSTRPSPPAPDQAPTGPAAGEGWCSHRLGESSGQGLHHHPPRMWGPRSAWQPGPVWGRRLCGRGQGGRCVLCLKTERCPGRECRRTMGNTPGCRPLTNAICY